MTRKKALLLTALITLTLTVGCRSDEGSPEVAEAAGEPGVVHPEKWPQLTSPLEPDPALEAAVDELLGQMSVEQKVGQLIQPEINSITPAEVGEYHIGSVLNGGGGWPGGDRYAKPADWLALADAFWEASLDVPEGLPAIPVMWGLDAVHGHNNVIGATLVPHNIGLGAANDPDLMREIGRLTAREVAVTGQDWNFGPTVAVARDDRWGRTYESYSENPELVAAYAGAVVEGLQGPVGSEQFLDAEHLIATAKHFLGDGGTEGGYDQGDSLVTEEELRDVHGAGYVAALEAGVQSVMASFSSWHGTKMHGNRALLTDVLKEQMGFDGIVVGDWNGHGQVEGCTNESCPQAINAGLDIFMVPQDWKALYENTLEQVRSGEIPAERLDDAVRRILRVKMRAGLFDRGKPSSRPLGGRFELLGSDEHRAVARRAVRKSLVLLKNNGGVLPVVPSGRILVAGDGADDIGKQSGGWTITWQGTGLTNDDFPGASSIWDGIREVVEAAGGTAVLSPDGSFDTSGPRPDVAIVVFGEDPYAEFSGDRDSVDYAPGDDTDLQLLQSLQEAGVPVVSVFLTGRPLWVNPELNASDAFVVAWLPGTEGNGVADVLLADESGAPRHDFQGRLSFSWPKTPQQAVLHRSMADYDPLFPYGYGLTYADEGELEPLPEDAGRTETTSRTTYFDGGPVAPWRMFLGNRVEGRVPADSPVVTTRGADDLTVRAVDRSRQEDAREAVWSGSGMATLFLSARDAVDLTREANGEMALALDVRVDQPPASTVTLSMGCGEGCAGAIDVTETLAALPAGEWQTVAVRLRCFEDAGAEMDRIESPFSLATDGTLTLRLSDIRLVSAAESEAVCP